MNAKRVYVLSIDALNAGHLPVYGYERKTAPFLTELAEAGTVFSNCYSVSSHTREAMPTMLTGEYPLIATNARYELDSESIAETFKGMTGMFHSNPFISRAYDFDTGFDAFDDDLWLGRNKLLTLGKRAFDKLANRHYARASTINDRSLQWLSEVDEDSVLCWNHYMDVHGPYQPPGKYRTIYADRKVSNRRSQYLLQRAIRSPDGLSSEEQQSLIDLYDGEIRYLDSQVRAFMQALRESGLYEDSLIIITADHGEGLGSEGFYEHPRQLTRGLLHVPLLFAGPEVPSRTIDTPVSLRHLPATVLGAVGTETDGVPGTDLSRTLDDTAAVPEEPIFAQVSKKRSSTVAFYAQAEDTVAEATLDRSSGDRTVEGEGPARTALEEHVEEFADGTDGRRNTDPKNAEIESRLQALGYLDE